MSLTVQDGLRGLTAHLHDNDIPNPAKEARLLLAHVLDVAPDRMTLIAGDPLSEGQLEQAYAQGSRRRSEPMSHILGYREFWGRRFHVDHRVLDPRPETECLIEAALAVPFNDVLDLGTGSGCILVTLLAERPSATGIGVDASEVALEVAAQNADQQGVADRCGFEVSNWFDAVGGTVDLIVSNPPYIALDEMAGLEPELSHEPRMALTDEGDGLSCYRIIAAGGPAYLNAGGWLMVEIGPTQARAVVAMFEAAGLRDVGIRHDLDGRDRVILGQKPL